MKFGSTTCKDLGMGFQAEGAASAKPLWHEQALCVQGTVRPVARQESPRQRVIGNEIGMGRT